MESHPSRRAGDGHVHLAVARLEKSQSFFERVAARWLVVAMAMSTAALFALSFFRNWWSIVLYAPQYPQGLRLTISLTGVGGDVREIDMLNHYIGMAHLEEAAPIERRLAGWGIAAMVVAVLALAIVSGRRLNKWVAAVGLALPLGFVADSVYWMFRFGHSLDPHAPLRMKAFTPQLFGNGAIGQFETYAEPAIGFWMAALGAVLLIAAFVVRGRVCAGCARAGSCGAVCSGMLVVPPKSAKGQS